MRESQGGDEKHGRRGVSCQTEQQCPSWKNRESPRRSGRRLNVAGRSGWRTSASLFAEDALPIEPREPAQSRTARKLPAWLTGSVSKKIGFRALTLSGKLSSDGLSGKLLLAALAN
jgi:hypothetical protein